MEKGNWKGEFRSGRVKRDFTTEVTEDTGKRAGKDNAETQVRREARRVVATIENGSA
jgi:hypothetical protein